MFCYSKHMKGCMTLRTNINMTPMTVGTRALVCFSLHCYSSLRMLWIGLPYTAVLSSAYGDVSEKNFSWSSCGFCGLRHVGMPWGFSLVVCVVSAERTRLQLLIYIWCLLLDWIANILKMKIEISSKKTISKQVNISLSPANLFFPLPLVGDGLEGRLKH